MICTPYKRTLAANANTSAFTAKIPRITEPVNDGVVKLTPLAANGIVPDALQILPIGLGSDNDVFDMRLWGWNRIGSGPSPGILWIPSLLGAFTCTVSAAVGIAGSPVLNTERFADTITLRTDNIVSQPTERGADTAGTISMGKGLKIFSAANDLIAWILAPVYGYEAVEFDYKQTTGTPTMNCLIRQIYFTV